MLTEKVYEIEEIQRLICNYKVPLSGLSDLVGIQNQYKNIFQPIVSPVPIGIRELLEQQRRLFDNFAPIKSFANNSGISAINKLTKDMNVVLKVTKSLTSVSRVFNGIAKQIGEQLSSVADQIKELDYQLTTEDRNMFKYMVYEEHFKDLHIHIDDVFLDYLSERYGSLYSILNSEELEISSEKVFVEYWIYSIDNRPEVFNISIESNIDSSKQAFLDELRTSMGQANYISSVMMLHIYLEKMIKDLLNEVDLNKFMEKAKIEANIQLPWRLRNAGKPTKFRFYLERTVHKRLKEIESKSLDVVDEYVPLYIYSNAMVDYENKEIFQQRNDLMHFNENVKYDQIDLLQMLKLFQLLKVVLENQHVSDLLKEWSEEKWENLD